MKAYLLDIEGTTTPIDFVHKVLFPFAKERVAEFVKTNFDELGTEIMQLEAERRDDSLYSSRLETSSPESISAYLLYLIDIDRKSTPLKSIQGMIWQTGYESGEIRSPVFADVPIAFEKWKAAGKTIAIYSSGSVLAQQNLFRYTDRGDLTPFISDHFDTRIGAKRDPASYAAIAKRLELAPNELFFVSDIPEELDAAIATGMGAALSVRPGNSLVENAHKYTSIERLTDITI